MKKQTWEEYREDFDNAFNGAIENGHPAVVVAWVQAKSLVQLALADYEEELIEGLEKMKRKDTDPLHSYMPDVYNETLSDAQEFIKKGKV